MTILHLTKMGLSGKERRYVGEYCVKMFGGEYSPAKSEVMFKKPLTLHTKARLFGYVDGLLEANLWADDDGDVEVATPDE